MKNKGIKILATCLVAVAGILFLAFQSMGEAEYYVHAEDVVDHPDKWVGKKTVQVHGFAHNVPDHGTMEPGQQLISRTFQLESKGKSITVKHQGVVPDTFKEEAETVVKGELSRQPDGTILLTTVGGEQGIMAKCPSKYAGKQ